MNRIYCDQCQFLKVRNVMAETAMDSGEYICTGQRFYCEKNDKYFAIGTSLAEVGFHYCQYGQPNINERKNENG